MVAIFETNDLGKWKHDNQISTSIRWNKLDYKHRFVKLLEASSCKNFGVRFVKNVTRVKLLGCKYKHFKLAGKYTYLKAFEVYE